MEQDEEQGQGTEEVTASSTKGDGGEGCRGSSGILARTWET